VVGGHAERGLAVQVRREPAGHAVVTVAGDLDILTARRLREHLAGLAANGRTLIVGLDPVSAVAARTVRAGVRAASVSRARLIGQTLCTVLALRRPFPAPGP
jgi:anti-anti-sigma regulatory factor